MIEMKTAEEEGDSGSSADEDYEALNVAELREKFEKLTKNHDSKLSEVGNTFKVIFLFFSKSYVFTINLKI